MHIATYCNCQSLGFRCGVIALKNIEICSLSVAKWLSIQFETMVTFVTGCWAMSTTSPVPAILLSLTAVDILCAHDDITNTSKRQRSEYTSVLNLERTHGVACVYAKNIYLWKWNHEAIDIDIIFFLNYQFPKSTVDRCWNLHVFQVAESSAVHGTSIQRGISIFPIQTRTCCKKLEPLWCDFSWDLVDGRSWKPPHGVIRFGSFSLVVFACYHPNWKNDSMSPYKTISRLLVQCVSNCWVSARRKKQKRRQMHQPWNVAIKKQHAQEEMRPSRSVYLIYVHTFVNYVDHRSSTPVKALTRIHQPSTKKKRRDDGAPWNSGYKWNISA